MSKTALVVDDSRSLRSMICDTLADTGYQVLPCASANCAATQSRSDKP